MKATKIVITHSYLITLDPKQDQWNKPYPPLMTLQAAALLRAANFDVHFFDSQFIQSAEAITPVIEQQQPDILVIFDDGFNYLTKMCLTNMREAAYSMSAIAKAHNCKVIICSSDATDHYKDYLEHGADFILLGEGEQSLIEVTKAIAEGAPTSNLLGIAFKSDGEVVRNSSRPVMKDLDQLPIAAWDLIDLQPYRERWENNWGYFSLNVATTRGCPYKCNWCAKPIYGHSYKMRSPEHVVEEIKWLKENVEFDHIWFCDDIFGLKRSWVLEFASLVKQHQLSFRYKIQSRADLLVKDQYIDALKDSGCEEVWMGVESGSQEILDAMDKGITIAQIKEATTKLKALDIKPCFFIQFGYLNEQAEDIEKTIALICELLPHDIGVSVSYPLPGTKFFELVRKDLIQKANWTDSDDLDLMFRNTYSPDFYKQLHRFVHKKFRLKHAQFQWQQLSHSISNWNQNNWKKALSLIYYLPATYLAKRQLKQLQNESPKSI